MLRRWLFPIISGVDIFKEKVDSLGLISDLGGEAGAELCWAFSGYAFEHAGEMLGILET